MGPLDLFTGPLRSLLGVTEDMERDARSLLSESSELERQLEEAVASIHRAAQSTEHHVEVVETLATNSPRARRLGQCARRGDARAQFHFEAHPAAERDLSRLGHLFGHRHAAGETTAETQAPIEPPADSGSI